MPTNLNNFINIAELILDYKLLLFEQMLDRQMVELGENRKEVRDAPQN
jgi:hypothetical protein